MTSCFKGQGNTSKSNWPSLKDLVINQAKINEDMNKRLLANDKTLESLTTKMDSLASSVKDQLNFNKVSVSNNTNCCHCSIFY